MQVASGAAKTDALKQARPLLWTSGAFLTGVLLHLDRVPVWASLIAVSFVAWRIAAVVLPIRLPRRHTRAALTLLLIAAVLMMFRTLNGLAAGTALLVVMGAVKILETGQRRDQYFVIGAALFLLLAACLDRQSLLRTPLYVLQAWLCCTAMVIASHPQSTLSTRGAAVLAARSLLFALPLALVLFLFFPRLPGAFWALPRSDQAITGLSERMSPGSISQLSESDEPAFRVWFEDAPPPPHERYWRGPVLHDFDGYTWSRPYNRFFVRNTIEPLGHAYNYRVMLEPHSGNWWYGLDTVTTAPRGALLTTDYQLQRPEPVSEPRTYEATSHTRVRVTGSLSLTERRVDTRLPSNRNPRTQELARELSNRARSQEEFVASVLDLFRSGGFEYTLTPPKLHLDSVDDFLFNTRRGFCGHYASAFVALMRAAGVPSRVVTGYLGAEWNPIGRYYIVRQSDAHAWAEIWVERQGWVRIDPTGVVAPERLQRGILDLLPDSRSAPVRLVREMAWLARTAQAWDALNAWWHREVIQFDLKSQLNLLGRLGVNAPSWQQLGWALAFGLIAWLIGMAWYLGRVPRLTNPDRIARAYDRLCRKLARAGVPRQPHHGPLDYSELIISKRPDLADKVRPLLRSYAALRFGPGGSRNTAIRAFEREVARLRVARSRS